MFCPECMESTGKPCWDSCPQSKPARSLQGKLTMDAYRDSQLQKLNKFLETLDLQFFAQDGNVMISLIGADRDHAVRMNPEFCRMRTILSNDDTPDDCDLPDTSV